MFQFFAAVHKSIFKFGSKDTPFKMSPNLSAYVHVSLYTIEDLSFILSDNFAQGISNLKEEHRVVIIYL